MAKGSKKKSKKDGGGGGGGKKASKGKKGKGKKGPLSKQDMELAKKRAEQEALERQKREAELQAIADKKAEIERMEREGQLVSSAHCIYTFDRWVLGRIEKNRDLQEWKIFVACRNVPNFVKLSEVNAYLEYWRCQLEKPNMKTLLKLAPELIQVVEELKEFLILPAQACSMDTVSELGLLYHDMITNQQRYLDKCTYAILQDLSDLYDPEVGIFEYLLSITQLTHCLWGNLFQCPDYDEHNFQEVQFQFKIPEALVTMKGVYRLIKTEFDHYSDSCLSYFAPAIDNALKRSIRDYWPDKPPVEELEDELPSEVEIPTKEKGKKGKSRGRDKSKGKRGKKGKSKSKSKSKSPSGEGKKKKGKQKEGKGSKGSKGKKGKRKEVDDYKSKSKSKSKSPGGGKGKKGKGKGKSKGKGKGKKGKGKKGGSRERPKTEAELAKERERKEKADFIPPLVENELNLRMYHILGGTYCFQLLEIPPQPNKRGVWTIHMKEYDCSLKEVTFEADFSPPPPPDMDGGAKKTPEEMEKEAKRQEEELQKLTVANVDMPQLTIPTLDKLDPEEEAARLAQEAAEAQAAFDSEMGRQYSLLIHMEYDAPKKVLWFEPPIPVRWIPEERFWTQDGFYDVKFDERTLHLSFRVTKFGIFGLGHNRWLNLPYQTWELRPMGKNKVFFSLTASMAVLEFIIHGDLVCVSNIDNVTNAEEVRDILLNKYMPAPILIKTLRSHNLDVFPEIDSYAYVDGILTKDYETEDHLYQGMAVAATAFNFQWSRWNLLAGREKMVYQMRERHGTSSPGNYQMVLNTCRKCVRIDCTEVSPNYSETPVEEFEYQADLLNLVKNIGTPEALNIIAHTNPHHVDTVRILLTAVRPLTFS